MPKELTIIEIIEAVRREAHLEIGPVTAGKLLALNEELSSPLNATEIAQQFRAYVDEQEFQRLMENTFMSAMNIPGSLFS